MHFVCLMPSSRKNWWDYWFPDWDIRDKVWFLNWSFPISYRKLIEGENYQPCSVNHTLPSLSSNVGPYSSNRTGLSPVNRLASNLDRSLFTHRRIRFKFLRGQVRIIKDDTPRIESDLKKMMILDGTTYIGGELAKLGSAFELLRNGDTSQWLLRNSRTQSQWSCITYSNIESNLCGFRGRQSRGLT